MSKYTQQMFEQVFDNVTETIHLNPDWLNGTGYWDGAVDGDDAPNLEVGKLAKTIDEFGRRAFFIGTPDGNIVLFERYQADKCGKPYEQINYQLPTNSFLIHLFGSAGEACETKFAQLVDPFEPTNNIATEMVALKNAK